MGVLLFLLSTTHVNFPAHLHTTHALPISSHQGNGIAPVSIFLFHPDYFLLPSPDPCPKCALHMLLKASLKGKDTIENLRQVTGRRESWRHSAVVGEIIEWRPVARRPDAHRSDVTTFP